MTNKDRIKHLTEAKEQAIKQLDLATVEHRMLQSMVMAKPNENVENAKIKAKRIIDTLETKLRIFDDYIAELDKD